MSNRFLNPTPQHHRQYKSSQENEQSFDSSVATRQIDPTPLRPTYQMSFALARGFFAGLRELPHREDTARAIMTLYAQIGEPRKALEVYARLVDELKYNLSVSPDPHTVELADKIRGKK